MSEKLQLVMENELNNVFDVIGERANKLLLDFDLFEEWLNNYTTFLTGFFIGKYQTGAFDFVEEYSNEELFERLKALRNKGE